MIKIGKLTIILLFYSYISAANIELKILSSDGQKIDFVPVGVPFEFQVSIKDSKKRLYEPRVDGLENFRLLQVEPTEKRPVEIGKKATISQIFSYSLIAEKEGEFVLGPVTFESDAKIKIDKIRFSVKPDSGSKNATKKIDFDCKFNLLKKTAFVGEKVAFEIECVNSDANLYFQNIQLPEWKNVKVSQITGPEQKKLYKDSKKINVIRVSGYLTPEKSGSLLLNGLLINYLEEIRSGNLESFLSIFRKAKHIYTNSEKLTVLPLPPSDKFVNGVGKFKNFQIKLDKIEVPLNSGVAVNLSIETDADLESIRISELILPPQLKSYESKTSGINKGTYGVKNFEFIIQSLKEADFEIPSQEFVYFDPNVKKYFTLKTEPIELKILPAEKPTLEVDSKKNSTSNAEQDLKDQELSTQYVNYNSVKIPWPYFLILLISSLLFLICKPIYKILSSYKNNYSNKKLNKNLLNKLKKDIVKLSKAKKYQFVYSKFKSGLSLYFTGNKLDLTEDEIINCMIDLNYGNDKIFEFKNLINKLLSFTNFVSSKTSDNKTDAIINETLKFMEKLNNSTHKNYKLAFFLIIMSCLKIFALDFNQNSIDAVVKLKRIQKLQPLGKRIEIEKSINKIKNDVIEENKKFSVFDQVYFSIFYVPLLIWQVLFILILLLFILYNKSLTRMVKTLLIIALVIAGFAIAVFGYEDLEVNGIITNEKAEVHLGPDKLYPIKYTLNYLADLKILKANNSWYYILFKNVSGEKIKGWVEAKNLKLI